MLIAVLLLIVQNGKQSKCFSFGEWKTKCALRLFPYIRILLNNKNKELQTMLQYGQTAKALGYVKEVRCKRLHIEWVHLYDI